MKGKTLLFLVIVAVVLGGLAYVTSVKRRPEGPGGAFRMGQPVLPALQDTDTLNQIEKIVFASASSTVTVARIDGVWVAPNHYGYPIDFERIRGFLRTLRELTIGHTLTATDRQLAELNLLDPSQTASSETGGTRIELYNAGGEVVTSMLAGKQHLKALPADTPPSPYGMGGYPDGRYVRVAGTAFLIADPLQDLPDTAHDWMDTQLANVPANDIQHILISQGDASLTLKRPESGGGLLLPDLAEDESMDTGKVNSLAGTLSYLTFADIADPALSSEEMGLDTPVIYSARNKKDQIFTLALGASPDGSSQRYARLSASYTPSKPAPQGAAPQPDDSAPADEAAATQETDAEQAAEEAAAQRAERLAEIQEFNAAVQDWTYILPGHTVTNVTIDRETFVNEKEPEDEQDAEEGAATD